ncbi:MAG: outer membrane protein assembly factor, partial [Bacteroidota bacterium]|nr:outer membrane protein assembly factor [Bacteroidota bacterium]
MLRKTWLLLPFFLLLVACNSLKYVPEGDYLLNKVAFRTEKDLPPTSEIRQYLHQEPNERFLGLFRLNLAWYNLSGPDTTKRINRILRNLGEPPVIYEKGLTARSSLSMKRFLM